MTTSAAPPLGPTPEGLNEWPQSTTNWTAAAPSQIDALYEALTTSSATPTPPAPEWEPKSAAEYFEDAPHQAAFAHKRDTLRHHYKMNRIGPCWTESDELTLVNDLYMQWFSEPYTDNAWNYPALDLDALEAKPLRKFDLAPFKINYETYGEIKLRLLNTAISVKGHLFLVQKISKAQPGFTLAVSDGTTTSQVKYDDLTDLRSIPPMYVNVNRPGWLCRYPGRIYQQGINRSNTQFRTLDGKGLLNALDVSVLVKAFAKRQNRPWDTTLHSLVAGGELPSVRLSDDVAVQYDKGKVLACYRGRRLGRIHDNDVVVSDEDDLLQQWIERSVKEVGLELRA